MISVSSHSIKPCFDSAALAVHPDRRPVNSSLWAVLTLPLYAFSTVPPSACAVKGGIKWHCVALLWLLLRAPSVASLPLEVGHLDAERSEAALDTPRSSSLGVDFIFVIPGTFDKPLDFLGTSEGSHGRALSECVRAGQRCEPMALIFPLQRPSNRSTPLQWYMCTRVGS